MHTISLFGRPIKVSHASKNSIKHTDVGANLFIGNLDSTVTEKLLTDTFGSFGNILSLRIERDGTSGNSKRYAFLSFDNFDSSDGAI
jgi:splicing factor 3B subunit 4